MSVQVVEVFKHFWSRKAQSPKNAAYNRASPPGSSDTVNDNSFALFEGVGDRKNSLLDQVLFILRVVWPLPFVEILRLR